jgi:hypothetical protein
MAEDLLRLRIPLQDDAGEPMAVRFLPDRPSIGSPQPSHRSTLQLI